LEPSGWTYQIQNDLLINLNLAIEKSIFKINYMDISGLAIGKLGTYQTQLAVGMQFRAGLIPRSFNPFVAAKPNSIEYFANERKLPVWIFFDIFSHRIFHDATLNGGSFSDKNSYTIQASNTEKYTLEMASGISARVKNSSISIKLVYLSTEFKHGKAHKWGAISLMHNL
ncbi:MAG: DUF2219 family protein, partial [Ignavibacteria bacterium]|nr:DUF2219 family protein [Ignavibacteria bacterium]